MKVQGFWITPLEVLNEFKNRQRVSENPYHSQKQIFFCRAERLQGYLCEYLGQLRRIWGKAGHSEIDSSGTGTACIGRISGGNGVLYSEKRGHMEKTLISGLWSNAGGNDTGKEIFLIQRLQAGLNSAAGKQKTPMYASAWTQRSRREIRDPQQPVSVIMWKPEFREARL